VTQHNYVDLDQYITTKPDNKWRHLNNVPRDNTEHLMCSTTDRYQLSLCVQELTGTSWVYVLKNWQVPAESMCSRTDRYQLSLCAQELTGTSWVYVLKTMCSRTDRYQLSLCAQELTGTSWVYVFKNWQVPAESIQELTGTSWVYVLKNWQVPAESITQKWTEKLTTNKLKRNYRARENRVHFNSGIRNHISTDSTDNTD